MAYRISTGPNGKRWWSPDETIPEDHTHIRPATPDETDLIDRILAQDRAGLMPATSLAEDLRALMARDDVAAAPVENSAMDRAATEALLTQILQAVNAHMAAPPTGRHRVLEALNALAAATALTLFGTNRDEAAEAFFHKALADNLQACADKAARS